MEIHVNDNNFDHEVIESDLPVLVDFWARWCGPCRMVAPAVEALAREYHGKLKVCKVDVDEAADVAGKYGVMSIPTFAIFRNGEMMESFSGAMPKSALAQKVRPYIAA